MATRRCVTLFSIWESCCWGYDMLVCERWWSLHTRTVSLERLAADRPEPDELRCCGSSDAIIYVVRCRVLEQGV